MIVAAALLLSLTACSPDVATPKTGESTGRLKSKESRSEVITDPPAVGYYISHGALIVRNEDPEREATLTDARLTGGDGQLRVKAAYVVPMGSDQDDTWMFGIGFNLPPMPGDPAPLSESQRQKWEARKPLEGYRVQAGETVNLLVLVDMDDLCQGGMSEWVEVDYTQGGQSESLGINSAIRVPSTSGPSEASPSLHCP